MTSVRRDLCPRCGNDNGCEVARTGHTAACWCMQATMAPDLALAGRAAESACYCSSCATGNEKAPVSTGAFSAIER